MGMRLQYVSVPDSAAGRLRSDPDLAPSLLMDDGFDKMPPALAKQLEAQMAAMGLGGKFPRLVRGDSDSDDRGDRSAGAGVVRSDAVRGELEKSWHGLHFVLTGRADDAPAPLGYLLSGGEEVGEDLGYGSARFLNSSQVKALRDALRPFDEAEFDRRFDVKAMERAQLYPNCWDEDRDDLLEEFDSYLRELQRDLDATVAAGEGLLIAIT